MSRSDAPPGVAPYDLDDALGFWLHRAFHALRQVTLQRFHEAGFDGTPEQWAVLVRLWQRDGRTVTELAESTFRDKGAMSRLVDALAAKGLVERRTDAEDGRRRTVVLTPDGHALQDTLLPVVRGLIDEVYAGLHTDDVAAAKRVLRGIFETLIP